MKNISWMACILLLMYACKEDEKGQYPIHGGAPGKVTSARVEENFAGGAVIVYDIPPEEDAYYVRARYTLDDGTPMELKSSVYANRITIVGIGRSREVPVTLTVVDRSQNESEPVTVVAFPLPSPVYEIANSMIVRNDFGGIALRWNNPEKLPVIIDVSSPDEILGMIPIDRFYSSASAGKANVRGQESVETVFTVTIRDRWGNSADPISGRYTPIFEEKLDKSKFRRWNPPGLPYTTWNWTGWEVEYLWDDVWGAVGENGIATTPDVYYITFDMGQVAQISRFKIYSRDETVLCYSHAMMKRFELWGSMTPNVTDDFVTWQFLGYFESSKPSGLPLGQLTDEDVKYAAFDGEDFEVELCPPVRYMRIQCLETWGGMNSVQFREFTFWGQIQE